MDYQCQPYTFKKKPSPTNLKDHSSQPVLRREELQGIKKKRIGGGGRGREDQWPIPKNKKYSP